MPHSSRVYLSSLCLAVLTASGAGWPAGAHRGRALTEKSLLFAGNKPGAEFSAMLTIPGHSRPVLRAV